MIIIFSSLSTCHICFQSLVWHPDNCWEDLPWYYIIRMSSIHSAHITIICRAFDLDISYKMLTSLSKNPKSQNLVPNKSQIVWESSRFVEQWLTSSDPLGHRIQGNLKLGSDRDLKWSGHRRNLKSFAKIISIQFPLFSQLDFKLSNINIRIYFQLPMTWKLARQILPWWK